MIRGACIRIGLPAPREVIVTRISTHVGVSPLSESRRLKRNDGSDRRHSHAILVFGEPVREPVYR